QCTCGFISSSRHWTGWTFNQRHLFLNHTCYPTLNINQSSIYLALEIYNPIKYVVRLSL
ncbi:hypothetical protein SAMD00019534_042120, partial [Acytostelium subglobosum LB1]|uniref:hypothetical protein n=1 Tax=Acytostelium subglobosum LB1 TaxID=1410327 RepID=UPI000644A0FF